jgi:O-antigen/teichoic acid export membrane protein
MLFFGPYVAYVLFGEKFVYSGYLLQIGALFVAISIIIAINFNILAGLGKVKERAKIVWIAAIINFIANFILLKIIGVV